MPFVNNVIVRLVNIIRRTEENDLNLNDICDLAAMVLNEIKGQGEAEKQANIPAACEASFGISEIVI